MMSTQCVSNNYNSIVIYKYDNMAVGIIAPNKIFKDLAGELNYGSSFTYLMDEDLKTINENGGVEGTKFDKKFFVEFKEYNDISYNINTFGEGDSTYDLLQKDFDALDDSRMVEIFKIRY